MKKVFLIFLAIISFGCSSSDNNLESNSSILGIWVITQLDYDDPRDYPECAVNNNTYEFLNNGDLIAQYVFGSGCNQKVANNYEYSVEGSVMTIIEPNGGLSPESDYIQKYTIKVLTEDKLILELYYVDEGADNYDGGGITNIPPEERRESIWERVN